MRRRDPRAALVSIAARLLFGVTRMASFRAAEFVVFSIAEFVVTAGRIR